MKFVCDKGVLLEAVNIVSKAVSSKTSIPVLEGILVHAEGEGLRLTANDLEMGIECRVDADVSEPGEVVLDARMAYDIIRSLQDGPVSVAVNPQTYQTTIDSFDTHFEIKALSGDEFPQIPAVDSKNCFKVPSGTLRAMIRQTLFAIGTNENRFILTGSLFELNDNVLKVISVDGFRLAVRKEEITPCGIFDSFVIPGKTLSELLKLLPDSEDEVVVSYTEKNVLFEVDHFMVISRLLEGEFLNYEQIIPKSYEIVARLHTGDFLKSLERTSLIISAPDQNKCPSILRIGDEKIQVSCVSSVGVLKDVVPAEIEGGELEIGFNQKYLADALKACETDVIRVEFNTHLSPAVMRPEDESDAFVYIVLPVRLKSE